MMCIPPMQRDEDQIVTSLNRLAAHVSNKGKFRKASALVRQLLESGTLERKHGKTMMKVLEAAMKESENVHDPALRLDYHALLTSAEDKLVEVRPQC